MQIDPATLRAREAYALMISCIVPRPVAWVSTLSADGRRNLAPFSYFMGVSASPLLLAVSVGRRKEALKDTAQNVADTGEFVVNMATRSLADKMVATSGEYSPEIDEFDVAKLSAVPSIVVRPPGVGESPIRLECRSVGIQQPGSAPVDLILGEVVHLTIDDAILRDGLPDPRLLDPVARLGKNLYASLGEIFAIDRPDAT